MVMDKDKSYVLRRALVCNCHDIQLKKQLPQHTGRQDEATYGIQE